MITTAQHCFFTGGPLGNFHRCSFTVGGQQYHSAEQYFQAEKARRFGDTDAETAILNSRTPNAAKAVGRVVARFDPKNWDAHARVAMFHACWHKFTQNLPLLEILAATGDRQIVECGPDRRWGCGLHLYHPNRDDPQRWTGTNWLGEVLAEVRKHTRKANPGSDDLAASTNHIQPIRGVAEMQPQHRAAQQPPQRKQYALFVGGWQFYRRRGCGACPTCLNSSAHRRGWCRAPKERKRYLYSICSASKRWLCVGASIGEAWAALEHDVVDKQLGWCDRFGQPQMAERECLYAPQDFIEWVPDDPDDHIIFNADIKRWERRDWADEDRAMRAYRAPLFVLKAFNRWVQEG